MNDPTKHLDAGWCITCNCIKLAARSHKSRAKGVDHELRTATPEELEEYLSKASGKRSKPSGGDAEVSAGGDAASSSSYYFEFGRYKKQPRLSLEQVLEKDPGYVPWIIKSKVHEQYPTLRRALEQSGLLPEAVVDAETAAPQGVHAEEQLAQRDREVDAGVVGARRRGGKRRKQVLQPHSCLQCGGADHNSATCPLSDQLGGQRLLRSAAYRAAGAEARAVAKKKYTRPQQESKDYKEMPRQRAKAPVARSDLVLKRAPPYPLTKMMIEDGLFMDLQGQPCTKPGCNKEDSVLGQLVGAKTVDFSSAEHVMDISRDTVCYRCRNCRARHTVVDGNPLFRGLGHGGYGPSFMIFAWWGFVEDKPATLVSRELNINLEVVSRWYDAARLIIAEDSGKEAKDAHPIPGNGLTGAHTI
jgi:hypothetical protein